MADTMKQLYIECASSLGFGDLTKVKTGTPERKFLVNTCADGYIKATKDGDDALRSSYISALMLLFWGEIGKIADKCKGVKDYEYEDFATKLYECINTACEYQGWVKDPSLTAEQCIRSVIASRGAAAILYESNLDKNKANVNTASLDMPVNDDDGRVTTRLDLIEDENEKITGNPAIALIQSYITKNKIIEGIMLDLIAFDDCNKYTKTSMTVKDENDEDIKINKVSSEFWAYRLVQLLSNLPEDYFNYFKNRYSVNDSFLKAAIEKIKSSNNQKLYKYLASTLADARTRVKRDHLI